MVKFDRKFFVEAGRRGGQATLEKHGVQHFQKIPLKKKIVSIARKDKPIATK